jgi:2-phosphosulfolactate phosphatase
VAGDERRVVDDEQRAYQIRFDWGVAGAAAVGRDADVLVWVDAIGEPGPTPDADRLPAGPAIVAADVRTARAAAAWAAALQLRLRRRVAIAVIAAGDARPDGSVIAALGTFGIDATSPEAAVADAAYRALERALGHLVTASVTGRAASFPASAFRVDGELDETSAAVVRPHPEGGVTRA